MAGRSGAGWGRAMFKYELRQFENYIQTHNTPSWMDAEDITEMVRKKLRWRGCTWTERTETREVKERRKRQYVVTSTETWLIIEGTPRRKNKLAKQPQACQDN